MSADIVATQAVRLRALLLWLATAAALSLLLGYRDSAVNMSLTVLCNLMTLLVLMCSWAVAATQERGVWSVSFIYFAVFGVFHFGLTALVGLGLAVPPDIEDSMGRWFLRSSTYIAIWLSGLAAVAYTLGLLTVKIRPLRPKPCDKKRRESQATPPYTSIGFILLVASTLTWVLTVTLRGGLALFVGSYDEFLLATAGTQTSTTYFGIGVGMAFMAAGANVRLRRWGYAIFGLWALFAFPLGLRGEVLFPLVAAVAVSAKRRTPMSSRTALAVVVAVLCLIGGIRGVRQLGVSGASATQFAASPLGALAELGSSLRPVSEVVYWQQTGDSYLHGASYWAPIDRLLVYVIPGWTRPPAQEDARLMNVVVQQQVGTIGFSPVAEAYKNFGTLGVVLVMAAVGALLGWMDTWPVDANRQVSLGIILVPLLLQVRNAFTQVPAEILVGYGLEQMTKGLARWTLYVRRNSE